MVHVCLVDVMDVVFSVCVVSHGAVGARVWEVRMFRHAYVVSCVYHVAVIIAPIDTALN